MGRRSAAAKSRGTSTSSFGVSRREGHDAGGFYSRFSPPVLSRDEAINRTAPEALDRIYCADSRAMTEVPDASVALVVTSPPYFAGKEYEQDLAGGNVPASYLEYLTLLEEVFAECVAKLEPGGRIAVNVANLGRKPYRSLSADVIAILQDKLRLLLRGEVIWQKALGSAGSCAWGSFQRPSNPVLRDVSERVILASKGRFDRALSPERRSAAGFPSEPTLSKDEFMEATTDVWRLPSESATRVGHPAPFPVSLPLRLIHLFTYKQDVVLDPFLGSGTTAVAAARAGRRFVGYETDPSYVELCIERLASEGASRENLGERRYGSAGSVKEVAEELISASGFREVERDVVMKNAVGISFRARDAGGCPWLFDVAGSFSATGEGGLKRSEALWKCLGKAAVLHGMIPGTPLVLLTPDAPAEGSPAGAALSAVCGPRKPVRAVVQLGSERDGRHLRSLANVVGRSEPQLD